MQVRRGFHRIGMVVLVPIAILAVGCFVFALHAWWTAPKHVLTGPDGARIEFPAFSTATEKDAELRRRYGESFDYRITYPTPAGYAEDRTITGVASGLVALVFGGLWYLCCWAVGWVIAGFRNE